MRDAHALPRHLVLHLADGRLQQLAHFAQLDVQRQPSRLDPRHVEQVGHDPLQPTVRRLDFVEERLAERQPGVLQLRVEPFGRRADHRQRRLQFMRHRIQQRVIQPFRFLGHARLLRRLDRAITLDHHRDLRRECLQQIVVIQRPRVPLLEQHPQHPEPVVRGLQRQIHRVRVGQRVGESSRPPARARMPMPPPPALSCPEKRTRRVRVLIQPPVRRRQQHRRARPKQRVHFLYRPRQTVFQRRARRHAFQQAVQRRRPVFTATLRGFAGAQLMRRVPHRQRHDEKHREHHQVVRRPDRKCIEGRNEQVLPRHRA